MGAVSEELTIGELAHAAGVAPHVLRHWESMGLLSPPRTPAGRRRYDDRDRERVALIQGAKQAGLTLDEIGQLLGSTDLQHRRSVLTDRRTELQKRIAAAQRSVEMLSHAISCSYPDITECPDFRAALDLRST